MFISEGAGRAKRLQQLIDEKFDGEHTALANKIGKKLSQIGQWLSTAENGGRNMSSSSAREIERKVGLPRGWFEDYLGGVRDGRGIVSANAVDVPILNAVASMGTGELLPEHDAVVGGLTLDRGWVRRNIASTSPENLAIISGYGNSMEPTYRDGDLLLVDRGVTSVQIDGIYVFEQGSQGGQRLGYIKTLQRRPDGSLRAISDNKTYEPWDIPAKDKEFRILGRIVWAWNGKKL